MYARPALANSAYGAFANSVLLGKFFELSSLQSRLSNLFNI